MISNLQNLLIINMLIKDQLLQEFGLDLIQEWKEVIMINVNLILMFLQYRKQ